MVYIYKTGREELREQIKRHAGLITGQVLDVGAGSFARYRDLFNYSEYVRMNQTAAINTDVVGQIENIPFPDNSFDSVVCTQVLGDVYELKQAFSELYRVLRPHGILMLTENLFDPLHDEPYDYWRFTKHSLQRLAIEAGFNVQILEPRGGYHSLTAQLQARYWIEKLQLAKTDSWLSHTFSLIFKIRGWWSRWRDKRDHSQAKTHFTQGYLLIARKHA